MRTESAVFVSLALVACSSGTTEPFSWGATVATSSAAAGGAGGAGGAGATASASQAGVGGSFVGAGGAMDIAVKDLPGLAGITFYERTGGTAPTAYAFTLDGPELTQRRDDPLGPGNFDIQGTPVEFYDVYYSDEAGVFQADGSYLTISGVFPVPLPAGGGLNLAEIALVYNDQKEEFGSYVASFAALGDNAVPGDVARCIDGDLQTHTTMGNTTGTSERLRLTLGFASTTASPR
ncbi:MAG: hypothetical protein FJ096_04335 [Deltaproteobacteria bacterium]|nr:hypothetical protein [Deltaproteobacteria bacterium]